MLKNIFLLLLLLLLWSPTVMADNSLYLKIDLTNSESSRDSNSERYIVEVNGKELSFQYSSTGFPFTDKVRDETKKTLTEQELSELIQTIREKGINRSITENIPTDANGPVRKVTLSLRLRLDGETTTSHISGNYKIFRADGNIVGSVIENTKYIDAVESLLQDLRRQDTP